MPASKRPTPSIVARRFPPYGQIVDPFERRKIVDDRQYLGQLRLDTPEQVADHNALNEQMWLYSHLFQPVLHLYEKTAVGERVRRKWDEAKTPYERLLASGVLSAEQQARVPQLYEQTNPPQLREAISCRLAALWEAATTQPPSSAA